MKRVYKYPVPISSSRFSLLLPLGAEILHMGWQNEQLFLWARVDPDAVKENREFIGIGTGQDLPYEAKKHIATYTTGPFVVHIFDCGQQ